jgi:Ca2+-binding RTX toxin-like protein
MDTKQVKAATALLFMCLAVLARGAHAESLRDAAAVRACTIVGTSGNDGLIGTDGNDVICGLGGNDLIDGLGGNDIIFGGPGNDRIQGGLGRDTVYGGPGNDTIDTWDGQVDHVDGGPGRDHAYYDRNLDKLKHIEVPPQ